MNSLEKNQRYNYPAIWGVDMFGELGAEEANRRADEMVAKQKGFSG